ncbi:hypothetical protein [Paenibacillus sp. IHB B 3415]|nr:hypothetical protein [Paenibacillus sp. IHB B 3415]
MLMISFGALDPEQMSCAAQPQVPMMRFAEWMTLGFISVLRME